LEEGEHSQTKNKEMDGDTISLIEKHEELCKD